MRSRRVVSHLCVFVCTCDWICHCVSVLACEFFWGVGTCWPSSSTGRNPLSKSGSVCAAACAASPVLAAKKKCLPLAFFFLLNLCVILQTKVVFGSIW